MLSIGVDGVAAVTVINYLLMIGLMLYFALADACQILISQNFGAKLKQRIRALMVIALLFAAGIGGGCIVLLLGFTDPLVSMFLAADAIEPMRLAKEFVWILWAVFLVNGLNVVITSYLTAIHLPRQSGTIAICRSLLLPASLLLIFYLFVPSIHFLWAIPIAEIITFVLAVFIFRAHKPSLLFSEQSTMGKD